MVFMKQVVINVIDLRHVVLVDQRLNFSVRHLSSIVNQISSSRGGENEDNSLLGYCDL
jgi:hypothetical protein